jgi:hypothetical protein
MKVEEKNGEVIFLYFPQIMFESKKGSEFIYDDKLKHWCLKSAYDETDIEKDNLAGLPMLQTKELSGFGIWRPIKYKK